MSSPAEFYNSLPPVSKAYATLCVLTTAACQLGLVNYKFIALSYQPVFSQFQLERGIFDKRPADFLWMMIFGSVSLLALSAIRYLRSPFLGISLVFMLLYVWSREYPDAQINIYGLVTLKAFYLPWAMLTLDVIFGSPLMPDLMGIIAGHLYYFLTVLYPLSSGRNILKTPNWVHRLVVRWGVGVPANSPAARSNAATSGAFSGRSYRLNR